MSDIAILLLVILTGACAMAFGYICGRDHRDRDDFK
jgi:hypothetical protein